MRKTIAAATVAASVAVGGLFGSVLGVPALAGAAGSAEGAVSWVEEALSGLVDDGTITGEQADAVETALGEARPERGFGHHGGPMRHRGLEVVADTLGMTEDEVREALDGDQTIAELAAEKGAEVQAVVDAIVADHRARLDEHVAEGDLTQEQADEMSAGAQERATAFVNGEMPAFGPGGPHHDGRHGGLDGPADPPAEADGGDIGA